MMDNFNKFSVGDKTAIKHIITSQDVDGFINLTGDDNKLHYDSSFASDTYLKRPVAHGMLSASFISTIIGTKLPGDGALWYSQTIDFLHPVRVGDTINVNAEVVKKVERLRLFEIKIEIFNQHRQLVISGTSKVKVLKTEVVHETLDRGKGGKRVLVIGATGGIGSAVCMQLAEDGFDVCIAYNSNEEKAKILKSDIEKLGRKSFIVKADVTNYDSCRDIVSTSIRYLGGISTFVNCATPPVVNTPFKDMEWDSFETHLDINLKSNFYMLKLLIPYFLDVGYGNFIGLTTQYTDEPKSQLTGYISSKAAMEGFIKSLVTEFSPLGVRFNMVSAGMIDTNLIADVPEKVKLITEAQTPLKRLGVPDDVAGAVSYLASSKSDFLTGETIRVNGGQSMV